MSIAERLSLPFGFDCRRSGWHERHRSHLHHTEAVLAARPAFLASHQGRVPRWKVPAGLRTVRQERVT